MAAVFRDVPVSQHGAGASGAPAAGSRFAMPVHDTVSRLAELSVSAARQAGSVALTIVRTLAARVLGDRVDGDASGWTRRWEPSSSRPVAEPPPPPSAPRRPDATAPAPRSAAPSPSPEPAPAPATPAQAPGRAPAPAPAPDLAPAPAPDPAPAPAPQAPAPPEPAHVDSGATVVAESADAGAADGAGAEVHVDEPWEGYSRLTARDVTAQLATANPATLAVVRLYESSHRNRRTVLAAVDRRLASADG
jgi:outer membrane biosynthesis protein TonB